MRQCDSLVTQLKQLSNILTSLAAEVTTRKENIQIQTPTKKTVSEIGINTDADVVEPVPENIASTKKVTAEVETQTETDDCGEVPWIFYNTLMSDPSLQQKLAMVINENLTDSSNSNSSKNLYNYSFTSNLINAKLK